MKKVILILGVCAVLAACGGGSKSESADTTAAASTAPATPAAATASTASREIDTTNAGGKLIHKSDCLTCHKIDTKVIGPPYADVAAKYPATEANIDTLAHKVMKGGKGNWGDVPMAAHPTISLADAKTMVTYILSLKKQ
jgi:cytochrome c